MCRAFHTAEAVSVGDVTSCGSDIAARCWLTRASTCAASVPFAAGQSEAGVQSPVATAAEAGTGVWPLNATNASSRPATRASAYLRTYLAVFAEVRFATAMGRMVTPPDPSSGSGRRLFG